MDTFELFEEIHERFYKCYAKVKLHHKFKIAVGGCPISAFKVVDDILEIDEDMCNHCGRCIDKCPFDAIEYGT
ncbi:4Fe-4S binding protein [Terrisporobacter petrolearius]|uniref:4Fe-4S binding protein n=1 Tax=Terrisporobacter petrolearius TaxID=1460447 RepID=UPI003B001F82